LIVIGVEVAPDHDSFDGWHSHSDYVADVREKLSNGDLAFLNVLCSLGFSITVSDQIALYRKKGTTRRVCFPPIDLKGRTIWIVDAHRGDGKRFIVRADEKLTAFLELESATRTCGELS
jgi:hypothetical protein